MAELGLSETRIPGLLILKLNVHPDHRGWFEESWQRKKMEEIGLPDFGPVQGNISYSTLRGTTRGIHAEPWDKFVTVASGSAYCAWVDLREGPSFGTSHTLEMRPGMAAFIPRGVGNSYQTLEDGTVYSYLVNDHWRGDSGHLAISLGDPTLGFAWPIPLDQAVVSDKDRTNPTLLEVGPMPRRRTLITGANGQLGKALAEVFPDADRTGRAELDLGNPDSIAAWPWSDYGLVLNAAAFTAADRSETPEGRPEVWRVNAHAPALLAQLSDTHHFTLVHYSSDYVFDGAHAPYREHQPLCPLGVYGQAKAAGDIAMSNCRRHYLLRPSWVIGQGHNFVRTMQRLAREGVKPEVVIDQVGRLTFADEIARATKHLLDMAAPYGTYHVSNGGEPTSWAQIAREVFRLSGRDPDDVREVTTDTYALGRNMAPRPLVSTFDLEKIEATGFKPRDAFDQLADYCSGTRP
jgi:dTDP-4-dehydrorhamnose reductase/dTDP-4-dehydrorhamnose 3,5-epimerase